VKPREEHVPATTAAVVTAASDRLSSIAGNKIPQTSGTSSLTRAPGGASPWQETRPG